MAYWLMKSEPNVFSYTDLENKPVEQWHGVRNFTARNNMKAMKVGERLKRVRSHLRRFIFQGRAQREKHFVTSAH